MKKPIGAGYEGHAVGIDVLLKMVEDGKMLCMVYDRWDAACFYVANTMNQEARDVLIAVLEDGLEFLRAQGRAPGRA